MITRDAVTQELWPAVAGLMQATLDEDEKALRTFLIPRQPAAEMLEFFGFQAFDILLKTILGRERLAPTQVIEVDKGRHVYIEFAWLGGQPEPDAFTADDLVTVKLRRYRGNWRIVEGNPSGVNLLLTPPRAHTILAATKAMSEDGELPAEPWILPFALYSGALQLPLQEKAMADEIEKRLLPGMQQRAFGAPTLLAGRRLWRDFKKTAEPELDRPEAWAAAVEVVMSEQAMREMSQAAVGRHYGVNLSALLPRVNHIKRALNIQGLDERYTAIQRTEIVIKDEKAAS